MSEEMIPSSAVNTTIIQNADRFMGFLTSETVRPIRDTISIIPNAVSKILDLANERRRLAVQENDSRRKAKMFNNYLAAQERISRQELQYRERDNQRRYALEIERIRADADAVMAEIDFRRETALADIYANTQYRMEAIKSSERVRMEELRLNYDLGRRSLDNEQKRFLLALRENNRRYNDRIRRGKKLQAELSQLLWAVTKKVQSGRADSYDYDLIARLSTWKSSALETTFDISDELVNWFGGGT